ncbi:MAG TPA: hypothetical protein VLV81_07970 [Acidimicrobiia bacterium]|nr:hypothetical protein [Acidimicrobiia bacterium]
MRVRAQDPHGRRWVVARPVLSWTPHVRLRSLIDDLPLSRVNVDAPPDVTSAARVRATAHAREAGTLTYGSVLVVIELPLLVVQAVVWAVQAVATFAYKTARRRPWTITGGSALPEPARFALTVVGWGASRARVHAIAADLDAGREPPRTG